MSRGSVTWRQPSGQGCRCGTSPNARRTAPICHPAQTKSKHDQQEALHSTTHAHACVMQSGVAQCQWVASMHIQPHNFAAAHVSRLRSHVTDPRGTKKVACNQKARRLTPCIHSIGCPPTPQQSPVHKCRCSIAIGRVPIASGPAGGIVTSRAPGIHMSRSLPLPPFSFVRLIFIEATRCCVNSKGHFTVTTLSMPNSLCSSSARLSS